MEDPMKILVTGGAGFIGSAVCRHIIKNTNHAVINLDALTYAGDLSTVEDIAQSERYAFEKADIRDADALDRIFAEHKPDAVMHLAAESHVDRSIDGPSVFIETNIIGTYNMLQASRKYFETLDDTAAGQFRFHHISTDEVYGSLLPEDDAFTEESAYVPNSPYSASKASSDHLVRAWGETYDLPVIISNCSNNYGPYQYPEKLIPVIILNAVKGNNIPVYGKGDNVRDWLYVDDHARALVDIIIKGVPGEKYNVGGGAERTNIDVVRQVCDVLDEMLDDDTNKPHRSLIEFVTDRPGHDFRYAIDFTKIAKELGWKPQENFESGIRKTVEWYLSHLDWCARTGQNIHTQRLGKSSKKQANG